MTTQTYEQWLRATLDPIAASLESYVRERQEGSPEGTSSIHGMLSIAWDSYQILVNEDTRYRASKILSGFLEQHSYTSKQEREAGYRQFLAELQKQYTSYGAISEMTLEALLERFDGKSDGQIINDLFDALFVVSEGEEDSFWLKQKYDWRKDKKLSADERAAMEKLVARRP